MKKARSIINSNLLVLNVFTVGILLCGWTHRVFAQPHTVDLQALTTETQRVSQEVNTIRLVWWIPIDYWQVFADQNPSMTPDQTEELLQILNPYLLVVVVDGKTGPFGNVTYMSESDIRTNLQLLDSQDISYRSLPTEQIDANTQSFLSIIKPIFANLLGPLGQNMHFFLFPSKDNNGQLIANAKEEGGFSITLAEEVFKWRLPLGSLLPPKTCPVCGEQMSGAWKYCPWDGTKLE